MRAFHYRNYSPCHVVSNMLLLRVCVIVVAARGNDRHVPALQKLQARPSPSPFFLSSRSFVTTPSSSSKVRSEERMRRRKECSSSSSSPSQDRKTEVVVAKNNDFDVHSYYRQLWFQQQRTMTLHNLKFNQNDKSLAGQMDPGIQDICDEINSKNNYFTLSSCSGRWSLFHRSFQNNSFPQTFPTDVVDDDQNRQDRVNTSSSVSTTSSTAPQKKIKKKRGSFGKGSILMSHDHPFSEIMNGVVVKSSQQKQKEVMKLEAAKLLSKEMFKVIGECQDYYKNEFLSFRQKSSSSGETENDDDDDDDVVLELKMEPMLLHVRCFSYEDAEILMQCATESGFKRSGFWGAPFHINTRDKRYPSPMVEGEEKRNEEKEKEKEIAAKEKEEQRLNLPAASEKEEGEQMKRKGRHGIASSSSSSVIPCSSSLLPTITIPSAIPSRKITCAIGGGFGFNAPLLINESIIIPDSSPAHSLVPLIFRMAHIVEENEVKKRRFLNEVRKRILS